MDAPRNEDPTAPRPAADSRVSLAILTVPGQANPFGTLHGGVMLRMADECGAVAALRHVGRGQVTTAAMDSMTFLSPVYVGERVEIVAEVTHAGRTSIETRIEIYAEALHHPGRRKVGSGYALYVALDDEGKRPHEVPPLLSTTEADRLRDEAARDRQAVRLARREEARRHDREFL
ncbi:acyl-CoA thioesterase [Paludisphaera mucosa]|uniref:Acyl-CoA thioesterase n=1 Tax=Paludisphaera mucosa TaxID=3030827 RepID=A0ABT6FHT8_9BACT|nr:acyl-CoA thioesterase [Paludisphaera mucosa]MDG3007158.1 acyl-CoA thioesterase [Paludisphaera mucosa]